LSSSVSNARSLGVVVEIPRGSRNKYEHDRAAAWRTIECCRDAHRLKAA